MKKWIFTALAAGLLLSACEKENRQCPGSTDKTFATTGFTKISAGGTFHVKITHGADFQIRATGCENDLDDLSVVIGAGGILELDYKNNKKDRYRVDFAITMPEIRSVNLSGTAKGMLIGFAGQAGNARAILSGAAALAVDGSPENIQVDLSGTGVLTLKGAAGSLRGVLSGAAVLQAFDAPSDEVDLSVSGAGKAYIQALKVLTLEAEGASHIVYRGNPPVKDIVVNGAAKVIRE